jgi:hypothetical protein
MVYNSNGYRTSRHPISKFVISLIVFRQAAGRTKESLFWFMSLNLLMHFGSTYLALNDPCDDLKTDYARESWDYTLDSPGLSLGPHEIGS